MLAWALAERYELRQHFEAEDSMLTTASKVDNVMGWTPMAEKFARSGSLS